MNSGRHERPERGERGRAILRAPSLSKPGHQTAEQTDQADHPERQTDPTHRDEQFQRIVVGMAPGACELRRLDQGKCLAKRTEAGAEHWKT